MWLFEYYLINDIIDIGIWYFFCFVGYYIKIYFCIVIFFVKVFCYLLYKYGWLLYWKNFIWKFIGD